MSTLPVNTPAEILKISPEALEVANCFLQTQNLEEVSNLLDVDKETILQILNRNEVKAYVNNVFFNLGFNNRFKMRKAMDSLIKQKFQELEESETGSSKDIAELLALSHKMTMDEMAREIELEKLKQSNIKSQVNVQINDSGTKYESLIQRLISGTV